MRKKYLLSTIVIVVIFSVSVVLLNYRVFKMSNTIDYLNREISYNKELKKESPIKEPENPNPDPSVGTYPIERLKELDLTGYDKLMISTHPDDEAFWGGAHLMDDNYLVVCVTCGMDDNRLEEFKTMMSITNDKYVYLTYPRSVDPSLNREFNWSAASYLTQDLINVLNLKDWEMIVTHNPEGEYGHKYHKLTSQIVTSIVKDKEKLYYFEKFYKTNQLANYSGPILDKTIADLKYKYISETYKSQYGSVAINKHMFDKEQFVKYSDWK